MKLRPVRIDEKPATKMPNDGEDQVAGRVEGRIGLVEGPAGVDAAEQQRGQRDQPAGDVEIPAEQIEPRERQVARADHHRKDEIAHRRRDRRDEEEPHHDDAVHGEQAVVEIRASEVALRRDQLEADQGRRDPPMKKKK